MTRRHLYLLAVLLTFPSLAYSAEDGKAAGTDAKGPMLKAPFTREEAEAAQNECGKRLGLPVEITNSIGMKLKLIPAGEFMMGTRDYLESHFGLRHKVRITKPFYIGVYEVTQAEYEKVMGKNPSVHSKGGRYANRVPEKDTSRHPVENVLWDEAAEFCKRLSAKEGKAYRLPTEAEWEYACRAGTTTRWICGNDQANVGEYAWHRGNAGMKTHPVGEKKPNAYGLHDMHGNVSEWCADWRGPYASEEVSDPSGPETGSNRVHRGGAWCFGDLVCRSSLRSWLEPTYRFSSIGFRVATDASGK
ncbi:MAG: formylglycine-generating enzyme family protein [Planctomycetes bacterium]|nr:formylglycine-generating enzyme family protein [Planctomycetota bacterium]